MPANFTVPEVASNVGQAESTLTQLLGSYDLNVTNVHRLDFKVDNERYSIYVAQGFVLAVNCQGKLGTLPGSLYFYDINGIDRIDDDADPLQAYLMLMSAQETEEQCQTVADLYKRGMLTLGAHIEYLLRTRRDEIQIDFLSSPDEEALLEWKILSTDPNKFAKTCVDEYDEIVQTELSLGIPTSRVSVTLDGTLEPDSDPIRNFLASAVTVNATLDDLYTLSYGITWITVLRYLAHFIEVGELRLNGTLNNNVEVESVSTHVPPTSIVASAPLPPAVVIDDEEETAEPVVENTDIFATESIDLEQDLFTPVETMSAPSNFYIEDEDPFTEAVDDDVDLPDEFEKFKEAPNSFVPTAAMGSISTVVEELIALGGISSSSASSLRKLSAFNDDKEEDIKRVEREYLRRDSEEYIELNAEYASRRRQKEWDTLENDDEDEELPERGLRLFSNEEVDKANRLFFRIESNEEIRAEWNYKRERALQAMLNHLPNSESKVEIRLRDALNEKIEAITSQINIAYHDNIRTLAEEQESKRALFAANNKSTGGFFSRLFKKG